MHHAENDESVRVDALRKLEVMDTPPDAHLDAIVEAVALVCDVPISLLTLVDEERQWFKANIGLPGVTQTSREVAFCHHTIIQDEVLEVNDALIDPRFVDNPLVTGDPGIRFYAGAQLILSDGSKVGSLCVIDRQPRKLTTKQKDILVQLAKVASHALQSTRAARRLREQEQALRKSALLLKHTGALADVGGWELDIAKYELFWSEQTCQIHAVPPGYKPTLNEAIGFYSTEAQPVMRAAVQNAIEQGVGWDLELPLIRANGECIWVHAVGNVEYEDGKPARLLGAFQNVTQKVNQRQAIEAAHDRMTLATDSGSIGIWEWDIVSDILTWTPLMYELYGLREGDTPMNYDTWRNCLHPDDLIAADTALQASVADGNDFDDEFRIVRADGEIRHLRATARLTRDENGKALRLVGVNWDVTPLRSLASKLAEQHELLHVTLSSIGDAVITTDSFGNVTWLNPTAEEMTGWSVDKAKRCPVNRVFHIVNSTTGEIATSPIAACLRQSRPVALANDTILLSLSGREYGIEESAAPIRNEHGEILGAVLVFHDVTEQRRLSSEMTYRATHDSLTGLDNRAEFESRVSSALLEAKSNSTRHAIFFVDLDQFKLVNDACGHSVGDQLLQQIARLMQACVRDGDTVARLGGDEFGVLLNHRTIKSARAVAQSLCDRMDEFRFVHDKRRFRIGVSIGLVPLDSRWRDVSEIMQAADVACYAAKDAGRNRVHVWFDTDRGISVRAADMKWAARLEQALDNDQFELYAQRVKNLKNTDTGLHLEVLLRMRASNGTMVSPDNFLPAAERFHLATRIDRWVLKHAIKKLLSLPDLATVSTLCINLSGQSVGDRFFHRDAIELLEKAGTDACKRICVEITETAVVTNMADASIFIDQLHFLGIRVALDDFGAGASSFGYLKSLNVDTLKIDGQFIKNVLNDPLDAAAVRCFIDVANVQGLRTVAEYVATADVLAHVKKMGIDFAQGFLYHKPEAIDQVLSGSTSQPLMLETNS